MIERLNFYDLYGYLLPGLTLIGLLWLPYGLIAKSGPPAELGSALLVSAAGYVVGHVLHEVSRWAFPSHSVRDGAISYPSDELLDDRDRRLSGAVKAEILAKVGELYGIPAIRESRGEVFRLCRTTLLQQKRGAYAEQFEGMYALTRGVAAGCFLGTAYFLGWAIGSGLSHWLLAPVVVLALASAGELVLLCVKIQTVPESAKPGSRWPPYCYWGFAVTLGLVGTALAIEKQPEMDGGMWARFLVLALVTGAVGVVCLAAYKSFTLAFARTVYTDFLGLPKKPADGSKSGEES